MIAENLGVQAHHDKRGHEAKNYQTNLANLAARYHSVRLERSGTGRVAFSRNQA